MAAAARSWLRRSSAALSLLSLPLVYGVPCNAAESSPDERDCTYARLKKSLVVQGDMKELSASAVVHEQSLTWNTLHGPGRFEKVTMLYNKDSQEIAGIFHFGANICGHRQIIHGGAIAVAFDETLGWLAHLVGQQCFTAYLHIDYKRPLPSHTLGVVKGRVVSIEGRKIKLEARLLGPNGVEHARAEALFVIPKSNAFHGPSPVAEPVSAS